jgi:F0F1-type ATP synthase membrane subunit b/b'
MSEQEKNKLVEEHLPSLESIIDEYKAQGKTLTAEEAEAVREQLRADLVAGHVDAMENVLGDNLLDAVAGGIASFPSRGPIPNKNNDNDDNDSGPLEYARRW